MGELEALRECSPLARPGVPVLQREQPRVVHVRDLAGEPGGVSWPGLELGQVNAVPWPPEFSAEGKVVGSQAPSFTGCSFSHTSPASGTRHPHKK